MKRFSFLQKSMAYGAVISFMTALGITLARWFDPTLFSLGVFIVWMLTGIVYLVIFVATIKHTV